VSKFIKQLIEYPTTINLMAHF